MRIRCAVAKCRGARETSARKFNHLWHTWHWQISSYVPRTWYSFSWGSASCYQVTVASFLAGPQRPSSVCLITPSSVKYPTRALKPPRTYRYRILLSRDQTIYCFNSSWARRLLKEVRLAQTAIPRSWWTVIKSIGLMIVMIPITGVKVYLSSRFQKSAKFPCN